MTSEEDESRENVLRHRRDKSIQKNYQKKKSCFH